MLRALLLSLMMPVCSWAWTPNERCELTQETSKGPVAVSQTTGGLLLYFPEGMVADGSWVRVSIGGKSWRVRSIGGAVELKGGKKPFLEKNWVTVRADDDQVLGLNLLGTSAAWEKIRDCEPAREPGLWVPLSGEIGASTDDRIIGAIRRRRPEGLLLNSAGGLAAEAQRIGYAVREARVATRVQADGQCLAECLFILASGTPRIVEAGGRVGIPAFMITKGLGVVQGKQPSVIDSAVYFNRMGVDGGRLAVLATAGAHEGGHTFSPAELGELGLADTVAPKTATVTDLPRSFHSEADDWWLLAGLLLLVGVLGWVLSGFRRKA